MGDTGALGSPTTHQPVGTAGGRRVLPPLAAVRQVAGAGDPVPGPPKHHRRVLGVKPVSRPAGPSPGPNPTAHLVGVVEDPWRLPARASVPPPESTATP